MLFFDLFVSMFTGALLTGSIERTAGTVTSKKGTGDG